MKNQEQEQQIDYQLGGYDIDTSGKLSDEEEVVEFKYEQAAVFKRLADDIYESAEAGIREPLTNAITTCRKAKKFFNAQSPTIEIILSKGEQSRLTIKDSGEGIPKEVLEEVLVYIGRSQSRDDSDLSGMYGMGFLAAYKLVGQNGGFIMTTNPRGSEGPYSGLFKPGVFEYDTEDKVPKLLENNEYGTAFSFLLKPELSDSDIREWVEKHSRASPIAIQYKEYDENGQQCYNEDFYAPTLKSLYDGESIYIDNEYYEVALSPEANNDIILITSPSEVRHKSRLHRKLPWKIDIRLKHENGMIITGEYEGKIPVSESEYSAIPDSEKEDYVLQSKLSEDDIKLPEPTGTRDYLRCDNKFLAHVNEQLVEEYSKAISKAFDIFEPGENINELDSFEQKIIKSVIKTFDSSYYDKRKIKNTIKKDYNYELTDEQAEFFEYMTKRVKLYTQKRSQRRYKKKNVHNLFSEDKTVFTAISKTSWKFDVVKQSNENADVIKITEKDEYEIYEQHLGWKPLKSLKKDTIQDEIDISDETLKSVFQKKTTQSKFSVNEKELTIHKNSSRNTSKQSADDAIERYDGDDGLYHSKYLVMFKKLDDTYNISDYYKLADNGCDIVNCDKKTAQYMSENSDYIMTYPEYLNTIENKTVVTSMGEMKIKEILNKKSVVAYIAKETTYNKLDLDDINWWCVAKELKKNIKFNTTPLMPIITYKTYNHIRNLINEDETEYTHNNLYYIDRNNCLNKFRNKELHYKPVELYAENRLGEKADSTEIKLIVNNHTYLSEEFINIIESIKKDSEENNISLQSEQTQQTTQVKTKNGVMNIETVFETWDAKDVVLHVVRRNNLQYFNTDEFLNADIEEKFKKINKKSIQDNKVYIPIMKYELKSITDQIPRETTVISDSYLKNISKITLNTSKIYAAIKLDEEKYEKIEKYISSENIDKTVNLINNVEKMEHL